MDEGERGATGLVRMKLDRRLCLCVLLSVAVAFVGCAGSGAFSAREQADALPGQRSPPGRITFTGRNLFKKVEHRFERWRFVRVEIEGVEGRGAQLSGELEIEIDMASVETDNERLNRMARSEAFFDVERYPTARLWVGNVRPIEGSDPGRPVYEAEMEIEAHGAERRATVAFEVLSRDPLQIAGEMTLLRSDFDIGPPPRRFNPFSIRDEVPVRFEAWIPRAN